MLWAITIIGTFLLLAIATWGFVGAYRDKVKIRTDSEERFAIATAEWQQILIRMDRQFQFASEQNKPLRELQTVAAANAAQTGTSGFSVGPDGLT